jgi:hypothetical protein
MAMDELEEHGVHRIAAGTDVYDRAGYKVGTVARLHEPAAPGPPGGPPPGYLEVATGLLSRLGLSAPLFVPLAAVRDVTEGGVFLAVDRSEADRAGWRTRPPDLAGGAAPAAAVPAAAAPATVAAAADWTAAAPHYRRRWEERHAVPEGRWETYEPRYRFAWELARHPEYGGQPWAAVAPALGARWEVLHPEVEWDTVADAVRDAWEHVAGGPGTAGDVAGDAQR